MIGHWLTIFNQNPASTLLMGLGKGMEKEGREAGVHHMNMSEDNADAGFSEHNAWHSGIGGENGRLADIAA